MLSTAMVSSATDPKNQAKKFDPAFPQASTSDWSLKQGKISSIGLYIKYNPGSTVYSLPKFPRHECTNAYTTVGNSTDPSLDKIELQCLTGYSTVIASEFDWQERSSQKQTDQYSTEFLLLSTVRTTAPQRNTYRQVLYAKQFALTPYFNKQTKGATTRSEHYQAFRKPPPYRDKPSGTEFFNSTVQTMGATLRSEHYQAFRRPPPYRDKCW